jgi:hypothetical protein
MAIFFAVFFAIIAAFFVIRALTAPRPRSEPSQYYYRRLAADQAAAAANKLRTPHTLTKLGYGSTAFCQEPPRAYHRLGH